MDRIALPLALALLAAALAAPISPARQPPLAPRPAAEALITARPGSTEGLRARLLARGAPYVEPLGRTSAGTPLANVLRVGLRPGEDAAAAASALATLPDVVYAEPHQRRSVAWRPSDPAYRDGRQWALERIAAEEAWELASRRGQGVTVALIDTGIDGTHEEFARPGAISPLSKNALTGAPGPEGTADDNGHGTALAGIVAAAADNARGIAGLAPRATVLAIKALNAHGQGDDATIAEAIVYAVRSGARVINLALGGPTYSRVLHEAIAYALDRDVVVVAASGNQGAAAAVFPAALDGVLAVGAVDRDGQRAPFSSYGRHLSLVAPGVGVLTTASGGGYREVTGTSFAAAHVSAAAALLLGERPRLAGSAVGRALVAQAERRGRGAWEPEYGFGLLEAARPLRALTSGAYLRGTVHDADGPVPGVVVRAIGPAGERVVRADDAGAFAIEGLPPGLYTLAAETSDARRPEPLRRQLDAAGGYSDLTLSVAGATAVANGHFERRWASWTARGPGVVELVPAAAFDGQQGARLGTPFEPMPAGRTSLATRLTVPREHPRLRFAYRFHSYQPAPYNAFEVTLSGRAGARLLRTAARTPPGVWQIVTLDLAPFAGESVVLEFALVTVLGVPTWVDLDAVAVFRAKRELAMPDSGPLIEELAPLPPTTWPRATYLPTVARP